MPLNILSAHHLRQILMLVFPSLWTSSLAILSHSLLCNHITTQNQIYVVSLLASRNLFSFCCVCSMAGSAPEGTQFDARQFDQKLNEV